MRTVHDKSFGKLSQPTEKIAFPTNINGGENKSDDKAVTNVQITVHPSRMRLKFKPARIYLTATIVRIAIFFLAVRLNLQLIFSFTRMIYSKQFPDSLHLAPQETMNNQATIKQLEAMNK